MKRSQFPKFSRLLAGIICGLLCAGAAIPVSARSLSSSHHYYDVTREVTLSGTISNVLPKPSRGMVMGSHLLIATSSGTVDASLGRFAMSGKTPLAVAAGQSIEVTGVMKTMNQRQVFVVRVARTNGATYTIRTQHGLAIRTRPQAHTARKGAAL